MARMIPPVIDPECKSPGERELFRRLQDDPEAGDWTILHSLDVARHVRNIAGEADFVIIVPGKGVLCVEVKAHSHLRCEEGMWFYGLESEPSPRSPFKQAAEAMHSIRAYLAVRRSDLAHTLFWSAVIFTNVPFEVRSEEWHAWQVIDSRAFRSRPISALISGVLDNARAFVQHQPRAFWFRAESSGPSLAQCHAIAAVLRPAFEFYESPRLQAQQRSDEVKRFTVEQFTALDAIQANPRVAIVGPAGTGKTVLAIEAARRSRASGRRVLFVCYNRLLGKWLESETIDLKPDVVTRTLHSHMLDVAGVHLSDHRPDHDFWSTDLPDLATNKLLDEPDERHLFDELVVDEGQDILRDNYLDFLDLSLKGGLASGRWRVFGDFEKQAIYGTSSLPVEQTLVARGGQPPLIYYLWINCRNTPRIAALAHLLGGLEPNYTRILRPDDGVEPQLHYYTGDTEQQHLLVASLEKLYAGGFRGSDIMVLSTRRESLSAAAQVHAAPWKDRLRPLTVPGSEGSGPGGYIGYSTIHSYKGLEAPAVVVTDVEHVGDPAVLALFYVAITRALHRLVILAHESVRQELATIIYE